MSYIYILGIILFVVFVLSNLVLILRGFLNDKGYGQLPGILFFSGLFATALICLATSSNTGISWLSNITLLFGVIALICGLISQFIDGTVDIALFWILALLLIPLGIFCRWWVMTQDYVFSVLNIF